MATIIGKGPVAFGRQMEVKGQPHLAHLGVFEIADHLRTFGSILRFELFVLFIGNLDRRLLEEAETEAAVEETVVWPVLATKRRTAAVRTVVRRTTTQHMGRSRIWSLWINHVFLWIIALPVLAPLGNIAVHVVKSPGICWKTPYGRGLTRSTPFFTTAKIKLPL